MGVYSAPKGSTHFVASILLLGQMFQDSLSPSLSSMLLKSAIAATDLPRLLLSTGAYLSRIGRFCVLKAELQQDEVEFVAKY